MVNVIFSTDELLEKLRDLYPGMDVNECTIDRPDRTMNKILLKWDKYVYIFRFTNKWNWSMDIENEKGNLVIKIVNGECVYLEGVK